MAFLSYAVTFLTAVRMSQRRQRGTMLLCSKLTSLWQSAETVSFTLAVNNLAAGCGYQMVGHLQ